MDGVATLLRAIASLMWPLVALAAVVIFRTQIRGLLQAMRRLRAGPLEVELWDRQLRDVRDEMAASNGLLLGSRPCAEPPLDDRKSLIDELGQLAETAPLEAVFQAYDRVRRELRDVLAEAKAPGPIRQADTVVALASAAARRGLITNQTMFAAEGLTTLRNLSVHMSDVVTPDRALSYLVTADALLYAIHQNVRSAHASGL